MDIMRMTVTLDHDVALLLENAVRSTGRSKRDIVNEALRRAMPTVVDASSPPAPRRGREGVPVPPLEIDQHDSDQEAIDAALAHYFGLSVPAQDAPASPGSRASRRLRVVRN